MLCSYSGKHVLCDGAWAAMKICFALIGALWISGAENK